MVMHGGNMDRRLFSDLCSKGQICAHKFTAGCQALKQVRQLGDEPKEFDIRYFGHHTCPNTSHLGA
ncbi:putative transcription factor WRKY family [Helianthus annuus]|uniref:Putative WRKY domain-containing protein n=1 Tax=Helianthus annuus TaxID=4232 RepID=A0A251ULA0_HELAN|nr:putative transcription factor WRKY family [Helianthus annuus]KAJ0950922.1 putative transcription factor WRKY family [Helianthus annuus]